jgi:hypothetical protein
MTVVSVAMRNQLSLCLGVLKPDVPFDSNYQSAGHP